VSLPSLQNLFLHTASIPGCCPTLFFSEEPWEEPSSSLLCSLGSADLTTNSRQAHVPGQASHPGQ
jgi:hypothetical protein